MSLLGAAILLLLVAVTLPYFMRSSVSVRVCYPPGPKGLFLLNNLLDIPRSRGWFTYTSWKEQYGGLIFLRVFGQNILVINSREDAIALLDKRSGIYSDRPAIPVVNMTEADFNSAALRYSDKWRKHRKLYQQFLRPPMTPTFQPAQRMKVHQFLKYLLNSPEHFMEHYRTLSASIIMKILYDIDISPTTGGKQDHYVEVAEEADSNLSRLALACTILPTFFRLISYTPSWIPILGRLDKLIKETTILHRKMMTEPFEAALNSANPASCVSMRLLSYSLSRGGGPLEEYNIREICATAYAAGADTTVSSMGTFFLAMLKFPEVQRKAQKEIDEVIGQRLPEYDDRKSLPYVEAVYREVMRWRPVTPLGIPHMNTVDDVYNGCFIPKGTIILPNVWAMNHDASMYPDPDEFKPERFFNEDGELNDDMADLTFGFGRRLCPGRHMASASVWMTIVSVLSVFSIQPAKDEHGNEIPVPGRYTDATISHPEPFKCSISPRSDLAKEIIIRTA